MKWQPMPASARLPSGTWVEVLCGQPEQKVGTRSIEMVRRASVSSLASRKASRLSMVPEVKKRPTRSATTPAIMAGVSTGIIIDLKKWSVWCGRVDDLAA